MAAVDTNEGYGFDRLSLEPLPEGTAVSPTTGRRSTKVGLTQTIQNYQMIRTIGKGNFAKVKLAKHLLTGVEVAIKIIDKTNLSDSSLQKLMREVRIMKMMNHPNIVKLYEVIDTESTLYLVMEYAAGGEVFDYLVAHGRMKEKEARAKFREILSAVQYCHARGVIHRDLKAENLLLDGDMHIKIADFGFSNNYTAGMQLDTFCGSPPYAAPELFQGKKYDGPEVDVWSLGVILYTLVAGSLPFDGSNLRELRERVLKGKYRIPFYMSTECEQLLKRFLVIAPSRRANLVEVMEDKWINIGHEDDPMKPYQDPAAEFDDEERHKLMEWFGFKREEVKYSLETLLYDHRTATYMLLKCRKEPLEIKQEAPVRITRPQSSAALTTSSIVPQSSSPTPLAASSGASAHVPAPASSQVGASSALSSSPSSSSASSSAPAGPQARRIPQLPDTRGRASGGAHPPSGSPHIDMSRRHSSVMEPGRAATMGAGAPVHQIREQFREQALRDKQQAAARDAERDGASSGASADRDSAFAAAREDHMLQRASTDRRRRTMTEGDSTLQGADGGDPEPGGFMSRMKRGLKASFRRQSSSTAQPVGAIGGSSSGGASSPAPQSPRSSKAVAAKPRSLRFTFSMANTSAKPAEDVIDEIRRVLRANNIEFTQTDPFAVECKHGDIQFEMEVCKLPRLSLHGIRHKRMSGPALGYKNICTKILNELNLK